MLRAALRQPTLLSPAWMADIYGQAAAAEALARMCGRCRAAVERQAATQTLAQSPQHSPGSTQLGSVALEARVLSDVLRQPPCSLATAPAEEKSEELSRVAGGNSWLRRLFWLLGYHSTEAINIRAAAGLYEAVCDQVDRSPLHDMVQLPPSFYSRWCLLALHVWMLHVRLRAEGDGTKGLRQEIHDLFQEDVEVRVRQQISVRVRKSVEELEKDFYGGALALDEALAGKCEMWEPIHRNYYSSERGRTNAAKLLASYTKREMKCLESTEIMPLLQGKAAFTRLHK